MIGQALRGLGADAGQPRERLDQAGDGLDERGHRAHQKEHQERCDEARPTLSPPGMRMPPVIRAIFSRGALGLLQRVDDRGEHEVLRASRRPRDRRRPCLILIEMMLAVAGDGRRDRAAAGRALDAAARVELRLDAGHVGLHLLRHLGQVSEPIVPPSMRRDRRDASQLVSGDVVRPAARSSANTARDGHQVIVRSRWQRLERLDVRHDAAYADGTAEDVLERLLERHAALGVFGLLAQERTVLGEAEDQDAVADLDRARLR